RQHPPPDSGPPYFETGYPYGHDQFLSMAGASWAVIALAKALPAVNGVKPPVLHEAEPMGIESWMETVLFGSDADVGKLLERKFDPNSATKAGTTALMMAVPDLEKTEVLI